MVLGYLSFEWLNLFICLFAELSFFEEFLVEFLLKPSKFLFDFKFSVADFDPESFLKSGDGLLEFVLQLLLGKFPFALKFLL